MKTISKEFYVTDKDLYAIKADNYKTRAIALYDPAGPCPFNKITITFEVPEKKIEITESEFDQKVAGVYASANVVQFIKERLFGSEK